MAYTINTCLYTHGCKNCKHHRYDSERDEMCCWINEDLQGQERLDYLKKLLEHFIKNS